VELRECAIPRCLKEWRTCTRKLRECPTCSWKFDSEFPRNESINIWWFWCESMNWPMLDIHNCCLSHIWVYRLQNLLTPCLYFKTIEISLLGKPLFQYRRTASATKCQVISNNRSHSLTSYKMSSIVIRTYGDRACRHAQVSIIPCDKPEWMGQNLPAGPCQSHWEDSRNRVVQQVPTRLQVPLSSAHISIPSRYWRCEFCASRFKSWERRLLHRVYRKIGQQILGGWTTRTSG
jgi:hypothetical protein